MRAKTPGVMVVVLGLGGAGNAQPPDFSGTWTATTETATGLAAAPTPVLGSTFGIRQSADTLTMTRSVRETTTTVTFTLDGRETRSRIPGRACQADAESIETAAWEGNALALTAVGSVPPGGGARTTLNVRRLLRLRSPDSLVVEAGVRVAGESTPRQAATIYTRSANPMPVAAIATGARRTPATIAQVGWISGVWAGTTGPVTVEERWTPAASGTMLAVTRTIRNNVMTAFEFLCISERDGGLVYTAMPNGRTPPTDFTLTAITSDSATFESPAHDFPKRIRYARRADGALETQVSGGPGQQPETFVLGRQE